MNDDLDLMTLKTKVSGPTERAGDATDIHNGVRTNQPPRKDKVGLLGLFAVGFSLLSIFTFAPLFAPLGLIFGILALFIGQILLGITAIGLSVIGIVTSPTIMALASIGAFWALFGS